MEVNRSEKQGKRRGPLGPFDHHHACHAGHPINAIKEAGITVKTIVGGAPVTQAFADQIKADGYSDDAPGAVELARRLIAA